MKVRRLPALVMVFLILSLCLPASSAAVMSDIAGHPLRAEIEAAVERGLVYGYGDGTFRPDEQVTRAQFAAMLNRALGLSGAQSAQSDFSDVYETDWHYADVQCAFAQGYMRGYTGGSFRPDDAITRYEAATILGRLAASDADSSDVSEEVPDWAAEGVGYALSEELFAAFAKDGFDGELALTRAQAASVLWRFFDSFEAPPAFFLPASGSDRWLYKNGYSYFMFALCGRDIAASIPERTDSNEIEFYAAVAQLGEPLLTDAQNFKIVPLGGDTLPFYTAERVSDNLILYTICADATDSVPAGFTAKLSVPEGSALSGYALKNDVLTVEITRLGEAASAASNVSTMRRIVGGEVRRIASWDTARHAARYEAVLFLRRADGSMVEDSERTCRSAIRITDGRAELDYSYEINLLTKQLETDPEEGLYICLHIDAFPADGEPYLFYPVELAFTASASVELLADGNPADVAARMARAEGLPLSLRLVDRDILLSELPSGGTEAFRCLLELTIYDADGNSADSLFTLERDGGAYSFGSGWDLTESVMAAASGGELANAVLRANEDAENGDYSVVAVLRLTNAEGTADYGRVILTSVFTLS